MAQKSGKNDKISNTKIKSDNNDDVNPFEESEETDQENDKDTTLRPDNPFKLINYNSDDIGEEGRGSSSLSKIKMSRISIGVKKYKNSGDLDDVKLPSEDEKIEGLSYEVKEKKSLNS